MTRTVYGLAWPLIDEWRKLRAGHPGRGKRRVVVG